MGYIGEYARVCIHTRYCIMAGLTFSCLTLMVKKYWMNHIDIVMMLPYDSNFSKIQIVTNHKYTSEQSTE